MKPHIPSRVLIDVWVILDKNDNIVTFVTDIDVANYMARCHNGRIRRGQAVSAKDTVRGAYAYYMLVDHKYNTIISLQEHEQELKSKFVSAKIHAKKTIIKKIAKHLTKEEINVISE